MIRLTLAAVVACLAVTVVLWLAFHDPASVVRVMRLSRGDGLACDLLTWRWSLYKTDNCSDPLENGRIVSTAQWSGAYVTTLYDQSGHGFDWHQDTLAYAPVFKVRPR